MDEMKKLRDAASNCISRSDYIDFLKSNMPIKIEETEDGILMYLAKPECTCPLAPKLTKNADMLCHCTCGHEKVVWSTFFGKSIYVEIVESFLRGGKDCVIKIIVELTESEDSNYGNIKSNFP